MPKDSAACKSLFAPKGADAIYSALLLALRSRLGRGRAIEDPKQTCIHITAGAGAYAGLHPRVGAVLLTIVSKSPIKSKRIRKADQASRNRCHCDVLIASVDEIDDELLGWLQDAADLISPPSRPRRAVAAR